MRKCGIDMTLGEATAELRWFYGEADGVLGLRGAALEPSPVRGSSGAEAASRKASACVRWSDVAGLRRSLAAGA